MGDFTVTAARTAKPYSDRAQAEGRLETRLLASEKTVPEQSSSWESIGELFNAEADEAAYHLINGVTFGLGGWALSALGLTNRVDETSITYKVGEAVDTAVSVATLRPWKLFSSGLGLLKRIGQGIEDLLVAGPSTVSRIRGTGLGPTLSAIAKYAKATLGAAKRLDYRKTFFEAYPQLEGKVVVHHAIEQSVLNNYPGVISPAQLHSLQNLRGIPKELNNALHLSDIRKVWDDFYDSHPKLTVDDLLQKVTEIDNEYGHLFLPPIR